MSAATAVHTCPRCQLRFSQPVELADHLRRDHPVEAEEYSAPQGRVFLAVDPARPDPGVAVGVTTTLAVQIGAAVEVVAAAAPGGRRHHPGLPAGTDSRVSTRRCRMGQLARPRLQAPRRSGVADAAGTPSTWICLASGHAPRSASWSSAA